MPDWKTLFLMLAAVYAFGAVLAAGRLVWHIRTESRRHPGIWRCGEMWLVALMRVLAWPLVVIISPEALIVPGSADDESMDGFALEKKLVRRARAERRCSAVVRYRQPGISHIEGGEFFVRAAELEQYVAARAARSELSGTPADSFYGRRLTWLRNRNDLQNAPVDLPETWEGIEPWMQELLHDGKAKVRCVRCATLLAREELVSDNDEGEPGWNYDRLRCPVGHLLLAVKSIHLNCS
jgi:hypothetical protein